VIVFVSLSLLAGGVIQIVEQYRFDAGAGPRPAPVAPVVAAVSADTASLPGPARTGSSTQPRRIQKPAPASVNLNTADEALLKTLPGIGPALAGRIVEHRRKINVFKTLRQLLDVKGIGPVKLARIVPFLTL